MILAKNDIKLTCNECADLFKKIIDKEFINIEKFRSGLQPENQKSLMQISCNEDPKKLNRTNLYKLNHHDSSNNIIHSHYFQVSKPLTFHDPYFSICNLKDDENLLDLGSL